jgi:hypothetical protein
MSFTAIISSAWRNRASIFAIGMRTVSASCGASSAAGAAGCDSVGVGGGGGADGAASSGGADASGAGALPRSRTMFVIAVRSAAPVATSGIRSNRVTRSIARLSRSKLPGATPASFFHCEKMLSSAWHTDSMSVRFTARAAPLRLCASRKTVSTSSTRRGEAGAFSNSSSPPVIACKCSAASTVKASRS